jgi:phosphoglycerate dehydrogenase-like enzyme
MPTFRISSDTFLGKAAAERLFVGAAPHEIVLPPSLATSALVRDVAPPSLSEIDIAFGQPDVASILASPRLRWVHLTSAGYTRYDTPEFRAAVKARGLQVTNSTGVYAEPCAEHVFAFMLAQARRLPEGLQSAYANGSAPWSKLRNSSPLLRYQRVVILGFGGIATRLVEMLKPFDVEIAALRRSARGDEGVRVITLEGLPAALALADHVVNILPANADSDGFISAARLAMMKPGAVLYNIGRGTTVDQDALARALHSGHLGAAWLDVTEPEPLPTDHPLRKAPNCFITPHVAGGHQDESGSLVRHFLANLARFSEGRPLLDRVM